MNFKFKKSEGCFSTNHGSVSHDEVKNENRNLTVDQINGLRCWWNDKNKKDEASIEWTITHYFPSKKAAYSNKCVFIYEVKDMNTAEDKELNDLILDSFNRVPQIDKEDEFDFLPELIPPTSEEIQKKHLPCLRELQKSS